MPLGPREVLTTSATAIDDKEAFKECSRDYFSVSLTFGGNNVGGSDILLLFGFDSGSLTDILCSFHRSFGHLNLGVSFISYNLITDLSAVDLILLNLINHIFR